MGIVKRNLRLEEFLSGLDCTWEPLPDSEYKRINSEIHSFLDSGAFRVLSGDKAFLKFSEFFPLHGYFFSSPRSKFVDIYEFGGLNETFGYIVEGPPVLDREEIDSIECVIADYELSFVCTFSHEWQAFSPEQFYERNA